MADDSNKSEKATPHKLEEAKKKGQVAKSNEVSSLLIFIAFCGAMFMTGGQIWDGLQSQMRELLLQSGQIAITPLSLKGLFFDVSMVVFELFAPLLAVIVLGAILFNIIQTGPIFSTHPITPDFTRLNPVQGFKKLFAIKTLFELLKALLKVGIIVLVWLNIGEYWLDKVMQSYGMTEKSFVVHWSNMSIVLALMIIGLILPHALIDFAFSKWDFGRQMRMSMQDIKDEHKKREGDPQIKQKQKQIQKELLKKAASLKSVKDADVIITNPEHIAVALSYKPTEMLAPKILSMGADKSAAVIRKIARHHNVPIFRNIPLARAIYKNSVIDGFIPEDCYQGVAEILKQVLKFDGVAHSNHQQGSQS
ncbi:EscU/YscU/HrcU family type III secretion system export apparatus switch protein [Agaribacter marinus]|uniref:Flagellar biosynthetic protein FlhB n=1 Tax=Agaribacter marinus TaxID=1431249 RepID=A0AA37SV55_9ALTE|nr:EscU/YscU/HrcU family type III secretion system export apparatus switch protein [Agaribacter marinus]GLR70003.1 flagellar biosynthetic protein FlhB [Agaribacter marinus]